MWLQIENESAEESEYLRLSAPFGRRLQPITEVIKLVYNWNTTTMQAKLYKLLITRPPTARYEADMCSFPSIT